MRPVPIVPAFARIFIYGSYQKRPATQCNLRQVSIANATFAKLCQAMPSLLKTDFLFLKAKSAEKSQIHNIKLRFRNIQQPYATLVTLETLSPIYGIFRMTDGRRSQYQQLGDSWGAVGRTLGSRFCGHLGQLIYMHVKILKPEVKDPDAKIHA